MSHHHSKFNSGEADRLALFWYAHGTLFLRPNRSDRSRRPFPKDGIVRWNQVHLKVVNLTISGLAIFYFIMLIIFKRFNLDGGHRSYKTICYKIKRTNDILEPLK